MTTLAMSGGTAHRRRPRREEGGPQRPIAAITGIDMRRHDLLFGLTALLLSAALIFGGSIRENAMQLMGLELLSLPVIGLSLWRLAVTRQTRSLAAPLAIMAAIAAVPLIQLAPLPMGLWEKLPGRDALAVGMRLAGVEADSAPISLAPFETIYSGLTLLIPFGVFLGASLATSTQRRFLVTIIVAFAALSLALSGLQLVGGPESTLRFWPTIHADSGVGFFGNRNHEASLLVCVLPLLAVWTFELSRERRQRLLFGTVVGLALFGLAIVGIALTRSRAGLLLTAPALFASLILMWRGSGSKTTAAGAMLVTLVAIAAVSAFALGPVLERFSDTGEEYRVAVWPSVVAAAQHFSPVGAGIGAFVDGYRQFEPLEFVSQSYLNHAHNEYLEIWFEAGWLGLVLIGVFAVWAIWRSVVVWSRDGGRNRALAQAASVAIVLLALHSVVDFPLRTPTLMAVFALMCALLAAEDGRRSGKELSA